MWRRPVLVAAIGVLVLVAALFVAEALRDRPAWFMQRQESVPCPPGTEKGSRCYELEVATVGLAPGRARCTWGTGGFTTAVIAEDASVTRIVVVERTGDDRIDCEPA